MRQFTHAQEQSFAEINNLWPIAKWVHQGDGTVLVTCDDDDEAVIELDGDWEWINR